MFYWTKTRQHPTHTHASNHTHTCTHAYTHLPEPAAPELPVAAAVAAAFFRVRHSVVLDIFNGVGCEIVSDGDVTCGFEVTGGLDVSGGCALDLTLASPVVSSASKNITGSGGVGGGEGAGLG